MTLEQQIIDNALYYKANGKGQTSSKSGKSASWYTNIHQHFESVLIPHMRKSQENFVEYHPVWFLFGETASYKQGISSGKMYRHTYGTYGTGYICFTDKNVYITALNSLTQEYPLYLTGSKGFMLRVLEGMVGERNDRKPYKGDNTWTINYPSVVGAQITQVEGNSNEIVYMKTTTVDWQIEEHFAGELPSILTGINMGISGKLAQIWVSKQSNTDGQSSPEVIELLEKLGELKSAGIITETEFEQKKQELLSRI